MHNPTETERIEMMSTAPTASEETQELQRDASALAYAAIRFSGLRRELASDEWDALADKYGKQIVAILSAACDEELTRREAESQELDAWLTRGDR